MATEAGGDLRCGIGARLRGARERAGMSILQAAEKLHADPRVLEALEAERFDELGAAVFVRGHIRRYAELVRESALELQDMYAASSHAVARPDLTRIPTSSNSRPSDPRKLVVPGLILVIAVAAVGLVWRFSADLRAFGDATFAKTDDSGLITETAEQAQIPPVDGSAFPSPDESSSAQSTALAGDNASNGAMSANGRARDSASTGATTEYGRPRDNASSGFAGTSGRVANNASADGAPANGRVRNSASADGVPASGRVRNSASADGAPATGQVRNNASVEAAPTTGRVRDDAAARATARARDASSTGASAATQDPRAAALSNSGATAPSRGASLAQSGAANPAQSNAPAGAGPTDVATPVGASVPPASGGRLTEVTLRFSGDSWAEVYDAKGAKLFYDIGAADSAKTISGAPPLRVILGNPSGVAVEVNGKPATVRQVRGGENGVQFSVYRSGRLSRIRAAPSTGQ